MEIGKKLLYGSPNPERDLQMTTLNPFTYTSKPNGSTMGNIEDPEIWVWDNVTYSAFQMNKPQCANQPKVSSSVIWAIASVMARSSSS